jgi:hypothetical protein
MTREPIERSSRPGSTRARVLQSRSSSFIQVYMHTAAYKSAPGLDESRLPNTDMLRLRYMDTLRMAVYVFESPAIFKGGARIIAGPHAASRSVTYSSPSVVDPRGGSFARGKLSADMLVCWYAGIGSPVDNNRILLPNILVLGEHPAAAMKHEETILQGLLSSCPQPLSVS